MTKSLITRCPKCSTAFRVSNEVLSTAKGKVRCGQCFNIFDAEKFEENTPKAKPDSQQPQFAPEKANKPESVNKAAEKSSIQNENTEDSINPNWLDSLFDDKDLNSTNDSQTAENSNLDKTPYKNKNPFEKSTTRKKVELNTAQKASNADANNDLAPWEMELAKVEEALKTVPKKAAIKQSSEEKPLQKPEAKTKRPTKSIEPATEKTPDYMVALQSLAQTASEQTRPSGLQNQHNILEQLSAQESLAPLLEESDSSIESKNTHPWRYFFGILFGLALLASQAAVHFFDEGSRSAEFRSIYKAICSYYDCVLPRFEDVNTITVQHVRIQSHPSIKNTLLVNAIITNVSNFSQPMPKIALEFFDLNGSPVAARLFSPTNYLHKDFLDITYMPPNTPIHLVIPIQDPGARAVTHQLKTFTSDTRSY